MPKSQKQTDHDVIIELVVAVKNLDQKFSDKFLEVRADIKEIKENLVCRIESIEKDKAGKEEVAEIQNKVNFLQKHINENIETRVRNCEKANDKYLITLALYTLFTLGLTGLLVFHIFK